MTGCTWANHQEWVTLENTGVNEYILCEATSAFTAEWDHIRRRCLATFQMDFQEFWRVRHTFQNLSTAKLDVHGREQEHLSGLFCALIWTSCLSNLERWETKESNRTFKAGRYFQTATIATYCKHRLETQVQPFNELSKGKIHFRKC